MSDQREQRIAQLVDPIVESRGADLEFVEVRRAGKRSVVVVAIDTDGGISLDDIADYSRDISEALDGSDVMGEAPYTLEVTSPGVHRPLTLRRHWRRNQGRIVKVTTVGGDVVEGRIIDSDDDGVQLDVKGSTTRVAYDQVGKAVVQVEFPKEAG